MRGEADDRGAVREQPRVPVGRLCERRLLRRRLRRTVPKLQSAWIRGPVHAIAPCRWRTCLRQFHRRCGRLMHSTGEQDAVAGATPAPAAARAERLAVRQGVQSNRRRRIPEHRAGATSGTAGSSWVGQAILSDWQRLSGSDLRRPRVGDVVKPTISSSSTAVRRPTP